MKVMSPTPKAALSAVIMSAVVRSVFVPKDLNKLNGIDLVVGWGTGIATALSSPTQGFGAGRCSLSHLRMLARSSIESQ